MKAIMALDLHDWHIITCTYLLWSLCNCKLGRMVISCMSFDIMPLDIGNTFIYNALLMC